MTANLSKIGLGRDGGAYYIDDPAREATAAVHRDDYYTRDGGGVWRSTGGSIVRDGAVIDRATFQDLCAGIHPATGASAVRGAGAQHRAGWDLALACPKSLSLLWATGSSEQRAMIERMQAEAVQEALMLLDKEVLLEVRSGAGGHRRARATDLVIGQFRHYTSREGDPHLHVHNVIINVAGCADGKMRTLEPERLFDAQHLNGAAFRSALAQRLVTAGFRIRSAGRGQFEVAGSTAECLQAFSKRSVQIESIVDRSASAAQKQLATLQTRRSKIELPSPEALQQRWRDELAIFDIDPWRMIEEPARERDTGRAITADDRDQSFDPPEVAGSSPIAIAASMLFRTQSVITRTALLTEAFRNASLKGVGIDAVYAELSEVERRGGLVRLDCEQIGHHRVLPELGSAWTTPAIAACEARMLRATSRPAERTWIDPSNVETALAAAPHLSQEQREAVTLAANMDGVCLIEAGAGTGKTTLARVVVDAARASNLKVQALAPSWVAADEIARSIGIEAKAIAKWRHDLAQAPTPSLDADSLILVDEAGMVGTRDMEAILSTAAERQCKVVLLGDRRQLASVPGANALGAVADLLQRQASLTEVRRQAVPWQRAASVVMARGDSEAGLRAYARHDKVQLVEGEEAARDCALRAWTDFRRIHGQDTLLVTRKNSDATRLNQEARKILRSEGRLTTSEILVSSLDRKKNRVDLALAVGDRVRFGETLSSYGIRNGTRGSVQAIDSAEQGKVIVTFALDNGRIVEDRWGAFARSRVGRPPEAPRISHAYAGTVYAAQGRTVPAAVLYISQAPDARDLYVGLTRHVQDARIIVEQSRLDAAVRSRQADPRIAPSKVAMLEALFVEAQRFAEKSNVVDFVDERQFFIETGVVRPPGLAPALNTAGAARSAREIMREDVERSSRSIHLVLQRSIALLQRVRAIAHPIEQRIRSMLPKQHVDVARTATPQREPDFGR